MKTTISIDLVYDKMQENLAIRQERAKQLQSSDELLNGNEDLLNDFMMLNKSIDDLCAALVFIEELFNNNIETVEFSADDFQRYLIN